MLKHFPLYGKLIVFFILFSLIPLVVVDVIFNSNFVKYSCGVIGRHSIDRLKQTDQSFSMMTDFIQQDAVRMSGDTSLGDLTGVPDYYAAGVDYAGLQTLSTAIDTLMAEERTHTMIDSIYLYQDHADYVLTTDQGIQPASAFQSSAWQAAYRRMIEGGSGDQWLSWFSPGTVSGSGASAAVSAGEGGQWLRTYIFPLSFYTSSLRGALVFNISENKLYDMINTDSSSSQGWVLLAQLDGTVVSDRDKSAVGRNLSDEAGMRPIFRSKADSGYRFVTSGGQSELISFYRSEKNGCVLIARYPLRTIMKNARLLQAELLAVTLLVLLASCGISVMVSRRLYNPMRRLLQQIRRQGDVKIGGRGNEMQLIAETFREISAQENKLMDSLEKSRQASRKSYLYDLIVGNVPDNPDARPAELSQGANFCIALKIEDYASVRSQYSGDKEEYLQEVIVKVCEKVVGASFPVAGTCFGDTIRLIVSCEGEPPDGLRARCDGLLDEMAAQIGKIIPKRVGFGVGNVCPSLRQAGRSCGEAQTALKYRLLRGPDCRMYWSDIEKQKMVYYYPLAIEKFLLDALKQNSADGIRSAMQELGVIVREKRGLSYENVLQIFSQLAGNIIKYLADVNTSWNEVFGSAFDVFRIVEKEDSLDGILAAYTAAYERIIRYQQRLADEQYDYTDTILNYIRENYRMDIDTENVADYLGISYSYVRKVFKLRTGKSIADYIGEVRIAAAKRLLEDASVSVRQVASMVGYHNDQGFTRTFKKLENMTPGEYRSRLARDRRAGRPS